MDGVLRAGFFRRLNDGLPRTIRAADFLDVLSDPVKLLRPDDQVDGRKLSQQVGAAALGHAAEEAEDDLGIFLLMFAKVAHLADRLLLGHITDAACVEKDHIGLTLVFGEGVALPSKLLGHLFGVPLVHLTAVGLDEHFWHSLSCIRDSALMLNSHLHSATNVVYRMWNVVLPSLRVATIFDLQHSTFENGRVAKWQTRQI